MVVRPSPETGEEAGKAVLDTDSTQRPWEDFAYRATRVRTLVGRHAPAGAQPDATETTSLRPESTKGQGVE